MAAGSGSTALCIRTGAGAETVIEAVRREANAIDSAIPILRTRTMEQNVDSNILQEKLVATLAGSFGLLALLLAAVGLHGVMAHSVARRTREIGIRMALGAAGRAVLWMVLRDALIMVTVGAAIGIPAALALAKFASSLLFGIAAGDPFNALRPHCFWAALPWLQAFCRRGGPAASILASRCGIRSCACLTMNRFGSL